MKITHGLLSGQVLQRGKDGRGSTQICGTCSSNGEVEFRVLKAAKPMPGHKWQPAGIAESHFFCATLINLRTGGPYRVELRIRKERKVTDIIAVNDIFVGDVWILGGQSNMEGIGNLIHAPKPHPQVRAFFMRDEWDIAEEKLHYLSEAVDIVHNSYGDEPGRPPKALLEQGRTALVKGVSPGLVFGLEMYRRTRVPQGLIPCAHGGTSMAQWSPALRDQGGASLYGAMMRRFEKLGQPVAGVLWYQGESDANTVCAPKYTENMRELIASTRRDMEQPNLPWIIVQLGCHASTEDPVSWNSIQEQQRLLPQVIKHIDVAPAVDLELDDGIHIGGKGQHILGRRLARLADRLVHKAPGAKPAIELGSISLIPTPHCNAGDSCTSVQITYRNVAGKLKSDGRAAGFALLDSRGANSHSIFKTSVKGKSVILHTNMAKYQLTMLSVSYGHGRIPFCNITDSDGLSIPVIQAVPIQSDHAPFCVNWETKHLSGIKTFAKAGLAAASASGGWHKAPPRAVFGVLPKPVNSDVTGVFAIRTTLTASEDLDALLVFGANGAFKVWLNGKLIMTDPKANMPLNPSQYRADIKLKRGRNALLVAFAPATAQAHYGISAIVGTPAEKRDPRISS